MENRHHKKKRCSDQKTELHFMQKLSISCCQKWVMFSSHPLFFDVKNREGGVFLRCEKRKSPFFRRQERTSLEKGEFFYGRTSGNKSYI